MKDFEQKLENFFNPEILKANLIIASLYIAVFDNFKTNIVEKVKYFYLSGIKEGVEQFRDYEKEVLELVKTKKNKQIKATLQWLLSCKMITEAEIQEFEVYTNMRNKLAHEMNKMLIEGFPEEIYKNYADMINLFNKIERKWIIEIEMAINPPKISYEDIQWEEITSINLEFIKIMTDIAFTGNEKYMQMVKNYSL